MVKKKIDTLLGWLNIEKLLRKPKYTKLCYSIERLLEVTNSPTMQGSTSSGRMTPEHLVTNVKGLQICLDISPRIRTNFHIAQILVITEATKLVAYNYHHTRA